MGLGTPVNGASEELVPWSHKIARIRWFLYRTTGPGLPGPGRCVWVAEVGTSVP